MTTGGERRRDEHDAFTEVTRLLKTLLDGRSGDGGTVLRHVEIIALYMFGRLLRDRCIKKYFLFEGYFVIASGKIECEATDMRRKVIKANLKRSLEDIIFLL